MTFANGLAIGGPQATTPEPATVALVGTGVLAVVIARRRRV